MKIDKLQINAFGNIENREIELSENINIIYGKNETGKSTLLKFIIDSLYGISKNKKGREFSDYDRYKPWKTEEFSGKITYTLDNGNKYEVFRDFNKKNPKIYDKELNDISKEYTIDRTYGNQFFTEQTKIDEATFLSTLVSMQQEVKLGKQEQNVLLQKLANLAGTGEDNVSYRKAIEKINKKQIEEIGTLRSQGRPINIVKEDKFKLQDEIGQLEEYKEKQYEIEALKQSIEKRIEQNEQKLELIKELKRIEETEKIEKQKIALNENLLSENNEKIEKLKLSKKEIESKLNKIEIPKEVNRKVKRNNLGNIIRSIIIVIAMILAIILRNNTITLIIFTTISLLAILSLIISNVKTRKERAKRDRSRQEEIRKVNNEKEELQSEIDKITSQIELLIKNSDEQVNIIENLENLLKIEVKRQKDDIFKKYVVEKVDYSNIDLELDQIQSDINKNKLEIHSLELDRNNILPKLEKLAEKEEKLEALKEKEQELLKLNNAIELAKQVLEDAYIRMKENVTPKFTNNLSRNIENISRGKYKNVRINDEEGIIVEKDNGEYISSEKLSIGTIEQLYISLRLGATKELSEETMPIILDEAFAYYDDDRLTNILKYINEEFRKHQIIIFTCTNRERDILENLKIDYKNIEM
ncbi:MAG: AAA family ATPase [Clostridia bacterium]|nr:AAA family ATPase [Clostridia bacterium]